MDIILVENIDGLGNIGDLVSVKAGYGRNYLIPQKLAVAANSRNIKEMEHQKRQLERKAQKVMQASEVIKGQIEALSFEFALRAGDEGKLFGSVTTMELAAKISEAGIEVDRKKIQLDEPIKNLGDFEVPVKLPAGVVATLKVAVVASEE
jgi:large subunit ribosomal protein L9